MLEIVLVVSIFCVVAFWFVAWCFAKAASVAYEKLKRMLERAAKNDIERETGNEGSEWQE